MHKKVLDGILKWKDGFFGMEGRMCRFGRAFSLVFFLFSRNEVYISVQFSGFFLLIWILVMQRQFVHRRKL